MEFDREYGAGRVSAFLDQGLYFQQIYFDQVSSSAQLSGWKPGRYTIIALDKDMRRLPNPFVPEIFDYDPSMAIVRLERAVP